MVIHKSFDEWLLDHNKKIIRYLTYRRMFTPYEQENKFEDETQFEDSYYTFAVIESAARLGVDDWLLGLRSYLAPGEPSQIVDYRKLSEIQMVEVDGDTSEYVYGSEFVYDPED